MTPPQENLEETFAQHLAQETDLVNQFDTIHEMVLWLGTQLHTLENNSGIQIIQLNEKARQNSGIFAFINWDDDDKASGWQYAAFGNGDLIRRAMKEGKFPEQPLDETVSPENFTRAYLNVVERQLGKHQNIVSLQSYLQTLIENLDQPSGN